jgi:integrase/recombinase XerD
MIEKLFPRAFMRRRMAASHLGIILFEFAVYLHDHGYAVKSLHQHLAIAEHFAYWMRAQSLRISALDEIVVKRFLHYHLPRCRCPKPAPKSKTHYRAALGLLLSLLREHRGLRSKPPGRLFGYSQLLLQYDDYLDQVAGLTEGTRDDRLRHAREFIEWRFGRGCILPRLLCPADTTKFLLLRARDLKPCSVRAVVSSLRSLLRFLHCTGRMERDFANAVICPPPWPHSPVPDTLSEVEVKTFLNSFDRSTPLGRRDFAIALCLCRLGLRAHEVASLRIEDVNLSSHTLHLRDTKTRRARVLPLASDIAKALSIYIRQGRPSTCSKVIFVRHVAPLREAGPYLVQHAMKRALIRCGLRHRRVHILRHTFATRLQRRGVSLKAIADLLGHQSLVTTAGYTRVNLDELRLAALPWPEEWR